MVPRDIKLASESHVDGALHHNVTSMQSQASDLRIWGGCSKIQNGVQILLETAECEIRRPEVVIELAAAKNY